MESGARPSCSELPPSAAALAQPLQRRGAVDEYTKRITTSGQKSRRLVPAPEVRSGWIAEILPFFRAAQLRPS
jgi:hypothetical protein